GIEHRPVRIEAAEDRDEAGRDRPAWRAPPVRRTKRGHVPHDTVHPHAGEDARRNERAEEERKVGESQHAPNGGEGWFRARPLEVGDVQDRPQDSESESNRVRDEKYRRQAARNRAVSNGGAHWVTTGGRYGLGTHSVPFHSQ